MSVLGRRCSSCGARSLRCCDGEQLLLHVAGGTQHPVSLGIGQLAVALEATNHCLQLHQLTVGNIDLPVLNGRTDVGDLRLQLLGSRFVNVRTFTAGAECNGENKDDQQASVSSFHRAFQLLKCIAQRLWQWFRIYRR